MGLKRKLGKKMVMHRLPEPTGERPSAWPPRA
jgi:hypothetical protein